VLPLLRQLYDSREKTAQQLYMPLITLLLLSLHHQFHAQLHSIVRSLCFVCVSWLFSFPLLFHPSVLRTTTTTAPSSLSI
jgi:hypothetical protein